MWLAAVDELGDGTGASSTASVIFALTAVIRSLLLYGSSFIDRILPALSALEYIAEHRVASDALLCEARILRLTAQVSACDFGGVLLFQGFHNILCFPWHNSTGIPVMLVQGPLKR